MAAFNGCVWVAGGQTVDDEAMSLISVCAYDPLTQTWSDKPPMNNARTGCGLAVLAGNLYAVGGTNELGEDDLSSKWHMKRRSYN